jgi:hypothetical protein
MLCIQRIIRGYFSRAKRHALKVQEERAFWAALVFQRCWYNYNKEWVTFLLFGCLREADREQKEYENRVNQYTRNTKAKVIQNTYRKWRQVW